MIFAHHLALPKASGNYSEVLETLQVSEGLVYRIEIHFPQGCCGNLNVIILRGSTQIWPISVGQSFQGSGEIIAFEDMYLIEQPPFQFEIYASNYDSTFAHTCDIYLGIVSKELFKARFMPSLAWADFWDKWQALLTQQNEILNSQENINIPKLII